MTKGIFVSLTAAVLFAGCGGAKAPQSSADPKVVAEAKEVWTSRCVACHGPNGMGNGLNAAALKTKPRSFRDADWQKSTSDERIKQVIVEGGAAVGLSSDMAPNPDLKDKPEVVQELLVMIRGFAP